MKAMILDGVYDLSSHRKPLTYGEIPKPRPEHEEILVKIMACGVCHTELDEIEGRTPPPVYPMIPGHQVVGKVVETGEGVTRFRGDERVGIAWIFKSCGHCKYCLSGEENLCADFMATGRDAHGGYAEYMRVHQDFAFPIPDFFGDSEAAPLLCAGAIGYRSLRLTGIENGDALGLTGFGASAHLVLMMVRQKFPESPVYVFARSEKEREFALDLGAVWSGDTTDEPPQMLAAIIDTTPVWKPVVEAMSRLEPGGRLVINAIRKESVDQDYLQSLDYPVHLWMEKEIKSVANVARHDVSEFLELAAQIPIKPEVQEFELQEANTALLELKNRKIRGAKVLRLE
jgi:propanol-preferring alcohol dehydrogenase